MKIIYVAGPYTAKTFEAIDFNIQKAKQAAVQLWRAGWAVICPHLNTAHFEIYEDENLKYQTWIDGDIELLKRCDAIYMLSTWYQSKGAKGELEFAKQNGIKEFYEVDGVPKPEGICDGEK